MLELDGQAGQAGQARSGDGLLWLLAMPDLAFWALLAVGMRAAAISGDDRSAATWWEWVLVGLASAALFTLLAYSTEANGVGVLAVVTGLGTAIAVVVLCFRHAGRPWIDGPLAPVDH